MHDRIAELEAALVTARAEINAAWDYIRNAYSIEDREWFEKRYGGGRCGANTYPLQMAIHYLHKRDAKVAPIRQAAREEFAEELKEELEEVTAQDQIRGSCVTFMAVNAERIDAVLTEMQEADRG